MSVSEQAAEELNSKHGYAYENIKSASKRKENSDEKFVIRLPYLFIRAEGFNTPPLIL